MLKHCDVRMPFCQDEIVMRWEKYEGQLHDDNIGLQPVIRKEECECIMKEDVDTPTQLTTGKAAGSYEITAEVF